MLYHDNVMLYHDNSMNPKNRRVGSVDLETGEVLDGVFIHFNPKRNPYGNGWVMNSQEALTELAKDKDLKGETFRVLLYLLGRLDFENWLLVQGSEICEALDMKRQNVSKSIVLLEEKGILIRNEKKIGRSYAFRLNPYYGWKGKVKNLEDYRRQENDENLKKLKLVTSDRDNTSLIEGPMRKEIVQLSSEVYELSKQFDIPTEKLEKLLSHFQSVHDSSV